MSLALPLDSSLSMDFVVLYLLVPFIFCLQTSNRLPSAMMSQRNLCIHPYHLSESTTTIAKKESVPGNNTAYYTGPASNDQLLKIAEFDMVPNAPTL